AKVLLPSDAGSRHVTPSNLMVGTPFYLSPEGFREPRLVGPTADLWSLTVVLFEALTGHLPFEESSSRAMFAKILTEAPLLPSQFLPEFGTCLDAFFLRGLAKEPAERFQ